MYCFDIALIAVEQIHSVWPGRAFGVISWSPILVGLGSSDSGSIPKKSIEPFSSVSLETKSQASEVLMGMVSSRILPLTAERGDYCSVPK